MERDSSSTTNGKTVDLPIRLDAEGFVLNNECIVAPLHQYDRELASLSSIKIV